jgi:prepilin-type N-terminal cleavage/methylation domain-containing protein
MRRPWRAGAATQDGFTLTELLISLGVFSVVSAMVTAASVSGLHQQTKVQNREDALALMRTALQRIDRDIRAASPLLAASATRLVLREYDDRGTRDVTYQVDGTRLTVDETLTAEDGTTTTSVAKVLLTDLATSAVFSFAPVPGYTAPTGSGVNATTCATSDGSIATGCVGTITTRVSVRPERVAGALTLSDNGTQLRNAS